MKKILGFFVSVVFAADLLAVNYTWGFAGEDMQNSSGGYIADSGGKAFLYIGSYTQSDDGVVIDGSFLNSSGYNESEATYGTNTPVEDSTGTLESGKSYSYVLVLVEDSSVTSLSNYSGKYIIASGTSGESIEDPLNSNYYLTFKEDANDLLASGWSSGTVTVVPEPTSALMMLLGVAALGLRRKRVR